MTPESPRNDSDSQFADLWKRVTHHFQGGPHSIHGPSHWKRVRRNGLWIAQHSGADRDVVELFALFHDSCRWNDGRDPGHGERGAELAKSMRGKYFELPDKPFNQLYLACQWHTDRTHHDDPTIGTCWDADRLDLGRVAMTPDPAYLNTDAAIREAVDGEMGFVQVY